MGIKLGKSDTVHADRTADDMVGSTECGRDSVTVKSTSQEVTCKSCLKIMDRQRKQSDAAAVDISAMIARGIERQMQAAYERDETAEVQTLETPAYDTMTFEQRVQWGAGMETCGTCGAETFFHPTEEVYMTRDGAAHDPDECVDAGRIQAGTNCATCGPQQAATCGWCYPESERPAEAAEAAEAQARCSFCHERLATLSEALTHLHFCRPNMAAIAHFGQDDDTAEAHPAVEWESYAAEAQRRKQVRERFEIGPREGETEKIMPESGDRLMIFFRTINGTRYQFNRVEEACRVVIIVLNCSRPDELCKIVVFPKPVPTPRRKISKFKCSKQMRRSNARR